MTQAFSDTSANRGSDGVISGISIASFLQMLEQEGHSCTVEVQTSDKQGTLYFDEGSLIDAECGEASGIEAAYSIVSWDNPSIVLGEKIERSKQIEHPLGYILLNSAKQQDEEVEQGENMITPTITYVSGAAEQDPASRKTVDILSDIPSIRYFYLLNKAGKVVVHSAPDSSLGELIIYCIITSGNLRKPLQTKSPRRILMQMEDGSSLLIVPKAGKILAMVLEANSSISDITSRINKGLRVK